MIPFQSIYIIEFYFLNNAIMKSNSKDLFNIFFFRSCYFFLYDKRSNTFVNQYKFSVAVNALITSHLCNFYACSFGRLEWNEL